MTVGFHAQVEELNIDHQTRAFVVGGIFSHSVCYGCLLPPVPPLAANLLVGVAKISAKAFLTRSFGAASSSSQNPGCRWIPADEHALHYKC